MSSAEVKRHNSIPASGRMRERCQQHGRAGERRTLQVRHDRRGVLDHSRDAVSDGRSLQHNNLRLQRLDGRAEVTEALAVMIDVPLLSVLSGRTAEPSRALAMA
jgi:hypothetical protein